MSRCVVFCFSVAGLCALPAVAGAQGLPQLVDTNEAVTPRPSYRQSAKDFPPPGGRYGGGVLEYVLTGGRPEPIAPRYQGLVAPQIGYVTPVPPYIHPVPKYPAYYHGHRLRAPRVARQRVYQEQSYAAPGYAPAAYAPAAYATQPAMPLLPGLFSPLATNPEPVYAPQPAAPLFPALFAPARIAQPDYAPQTYTPQGYAPQGYAPAPTGLPTSGLPDYNPQAPDFAGGPPAAQPISYGAPAYEPAGAEAGPAQGAMNPAYARQEVAYSGRERPGTVVIDTPEKFLYLVRPGGRALRYGIGVGRPGFTWSGLKRISRKAQWPGWTPPRQMIARRPDLPRHMNGGMANPLGARALYLGSSLYRIHGTNEPDTIGTNVSSGCIRMMNADVSDLYDRVAVGTQVIVR